MRSVAKLVTKAFPVSGIVDNLNEVKWSQMNIFIVEVEARGTVSTVRKFHLFCFVQDLPDSIEVGGRISPQIVWDYLEKIRATGTKVCFYMDII